MGSVMGAEGPPHSLDDVALRDLCEGDLPAVVPMYRRAFRGGVDDALGDRYVRALLRWFAQDVGTVARVATMEGTPIAFTLGAPYGYRRSLLRSVLPAMAWCLLTRPWLLLCPRLLAGGGDADGQSPEPGSVFHFKVLEVEPAWRRGGLARIVSDDFVSHVFRAGYRRITATTLEDNTAVLKLMERVGYRPIDGGRPSPDGRRVLALDRKPRASLQVERRPSGPARAEKRGEPDR
ncbi:MAG: GNAT family protein [Proteobacteria bacterium]|nr:GNAT family protein [Pseudomonadota bacterium]